MEARWGSCSYILPPAESDGLENFPKTLARNTSTNRPGNLLVRTTHKLNEMARWLVQQPKVHVIVVPLQI